MLARHYGYRAMLETDSNNPYINSFYEDMRRWSFNLEIHYLHTRIKHLIEIRKSNTHIVQDRTLYEDAYIFTPNLHAMGLMTTRDFENYLQMFELLESFIQPPDLLIYLRSDVPNLIKQIQRRGRDYEGSIRLDYLSSLNNRYESWINDYSKSKMMIIDVRDINFVDNPEDFGMIINKIDAEFNSLFS